MNAIVLVADAAQVSIDGKLSMLGAGWKMTSSPTAPSAIAAIFTLTWDDANRKHNFVLELLTSDGKPVTVETPNGVEPIRIEQTFEIGRPPGVKPGTDFNFPFAASIGPLKLDPDSVFEWRLTFNGVTKPEWTATFQTRPSGAVPKK